MLSYPGLFEASNHSTNLHLLWGELTKGQHLHRYMSHRQDLAVLSLLSLPEAQEATRRRLFACVTYIIETQCRSSRKMLEPYHVGPTQKKNKAPVSNDQIPPVSA